MVNKYSVLYELGWGDEMVCMEIKGGQGNQMYQYALGRYLSLKNNCPLEYEMSYFAGKEARAFALDKFATVGKPTNKWWVKLYHRLPRGRRLLGKLLPLITERGSWFHQSVKDLTQKDVYLSGYWSSPKYFDEIKDVLRQDFTCQVPLSENTRTWKKQIVEDKLPTVSLHIRRGDYLQTAINRQIYKVMPLAYYQHCLHELAKKYGELSVYVFSNDLEWVRENMDFGNNLVHYVTGNNEDHGYEDMILMWECEHHIIANSTFSWWGAYLSTGGGQTFCPKEWFNIKGDAYDVRDLYPDDWIRVDID